MEFKIKTLAQVSKDDFVDKGMLNFVRNEGPSVFRLRDSYKKLEVFLKHNAETIVPQKINPFGTHFSEGIITAPSANSVYFLGDCLVENDWHPLFSFSLNRTGHGIRIAGALLDVDSVTGLVLENIFFYLGYKEKEHIYQVSQPLDLRVFSSISELEKELCIPEEIKMSDNLFEQTKNLSLIGQRLSGEPEVLHEIEDYFRQPGKYECITRDQIKRILQYVPGVYPKNWKFPENGDFGKLSEKEKQAWINIEKEGISGIGISGRVIQKTIELALEYKIRAEKLR
jgi:hypothetical protein